jgi:hypothetical protein
MTTYDYLEICRAHTREEVLKIRSKVKEAEWCLPDDEANKVKKEMSAKLDILIKEELRYYPFQDGTIWEYPGRKYEVKKAYYTNIPGIDNDFTYPVCDYVIGHFWVLDPVTNEWKSVNPSLDNSIYSPETVEIAMQNLGIILARQELIDEQKNGKTGSIHIL